MSANLCDLCGETLRWCPTSARFWRMWVLFAILPALVLAAGCSGERPAAAPVTAATAAPAPTPIPAQPDIFTASGPIIVEHQLDLAAQREGVVASILADVGTVVKQGQMLARLDDRQLTADRDAAAARTKSIAADLKNWEAETKVQEADLERAELMWKAQLITQQELDHARYKAVGSQFEVERERENLRNSEATLESLQLELEKTRIVAPFAGVVARRYIREGQHVASGERLFWLSATAPLRVRFTLPQNFLGQIKKGEEVTVSAEGAAEMRAQARIISVSPVVDPASGMVEAVAQLYGPVSGLRPGMTARIVFTTEATEHH